MTATFLNTVQGQFREDQPLWRHALDQNMCKLSMETLDGGHCKAWVECPNDRVRQYGDGGEGWHVCFVGGRQYFNHPRIGDFSIGFVEKDGFKQGQGLTTPIVQVKELENWLEIPVEGLARESRKRQKCHSDDEDDSEDDCGQGPFLCTRETVGKRPLPDSRLKRWSCAIPQIGTYALKTPHRT